MMKKTAVALSVAAFAASSVALPAAAASLDTPVQLAGCNPCAAKNKKYDAVSVIRSTGVAWGRSPRQSPVDRILPPILLRRFTACFDAVMIKS